MIFKFHHSLGDGPSLISLLASSRKMSDPSALPTFPKKAKTSQTTSGGLFFTVWSTFMLILNTLVDIIVFIATLFFLKDTKTPLKGGHGVAGNPKRLVHLAISLDDLRMVKKAMNVTINDVALGVTQAALSRYLSRKLENESLNEEVNKRTNRSLSRIRLRVVVMFSTRPTTSIESLADMMEKSSKVKWGNSFGYVLLPFNILLKSNPLHYVHQAKDTMDRKKHSLEALGTYLCSAAAIKLLGIETGGNIAHRLISNTTFTFSNVVGPQEEISLFGYPVAYIAPSVYGHPHACTVHFQSYADEMTIVLAVDQSVIPDPHELSNDFAESKAADFVAGILYSFCNGLDLPLFLVLVTISASSAQKVEHVVMVVNGTAVASTDDNYVCATIDWWPHDKCDYKQCPWGSSSIINLDLHNPLLLKAIQAFKPLRIRVGGSLQDKVVYNVRKLRYPCHPFKRMSQGLFGFSKGCLLMHRWDAVNQFFKNAGVLVTFGLNALYGRYEIRSRVWGGDWDSSNANNFINYTISKGYHVDSWEFGNESSGNGVGASVDAKLYAKDLIKLKAIINKFYKDFKSKPLLVAPGGFYTKEWYDDLLQATGSSVLNAVTHHIYNLGSGKDANLVSKILNPHDLSTISATFNDLRQTILTHGPWASAWVGESGGAYNSGAPGVSNTFVNSFWYLDQLGMAVKYDTKVYCRQTLVGGNYGLIDTTTFIPRPDYYSALLWHRLMAKEVLSVNIRASPYLRSYAHCSKGKAGITLLLINLSNHTKFDISVHTNANTSIDNKQDDNSHDQSRFIRQIKKTMSWVGLKAPQPTSYREEYHLTPRNGYLRSGTMLLNGVPLQLGTNGDIPSLNPIFVGINSPISVFPLSIKFVVLPKFDAPSCK